MTECISWEALNNANIANIPSKTIEQFLWNSDVSKEVAPEISLTSLKIVLVVIAQHHNKSRSILCRVFQLLLDTELHDPHRSDLSPDQVALLLGVILDVVIKKWSNHVDVVSASLGYFAQVVNKSVYLAEVASFKSVAIIMATHMYSKPIQKSILHIFNESFNSNREKLGLKYDSFLMQTKECVILPLIDCMNINSSDPEIVPYCLAVFHTFLSIKTELIMYLHNVVPAIISVITSLRELQKSSTAPSLLRGIITAGICLLDGLEIMDDSLHEIIASIFPILTEHIMEDLTISLDDSALGSMHTIKLASAVLSSIKILTESNTSALVQLHQTLAAAISEGLDEREGNELLIGFFEELKAVIGDRSDCNDSAVDGVEGMELVNQQEIRKTAKVTSPAVQSKRVTIAESIVGSPLPPPPYSSIVTGSTPKTEQSLELRASGGFKSIRGGRKSKDQTPSNLSQNNNLSTSAQSTPTPKHTSPIVAAHQPATPTGNAPPDTTEISPVLKTGSPVSPSISRTSKLNEISYVKCANKLTYSSTPSDPKGSQEGEKSIKSQNLSLAITQTPPIPKRAIPPTIHAAIVQSNIFLAKPGPKLSRKAQGRLLPASSPQKKNLQSPAQLPTGPIDTELRSRLSVTEGNTHNASKDSVDNQSSHSAVLPTAAARQFMDITLLSQHQAEVALHRSEFIHTLFLGAAKKMEILLLENNTLRDSLQMREKSPIRPQTNSLKCEEINSKSTWQDKSYSMAAEGLAEGLLRTKTAHAKARDKAIQQAIYTASSISQVHTAQKQFSSSVSPESMSACASAISTLFTKLKQSIPSDTAGAVSPQQIPTVALRKCILDLGILSTTRRDLQRSSLDVLLSSILNFPKVSGGSKNQVTIAHMALLLTRCVASRFRMFDGQEIVDKLCELVTAFISSHQSKSQSNESPKVLQLSSEEHISLTQAILTIPAFKSLFSKYCRTNRSCTASSQKKLHFVDFLSSPYKTQGENKPQISSQESSIDQSSGNAACVNDSSTQSISFNSIITFFKVMHITPCLISYATIHSCFWEVLAHRKDVARIKHFTEEEHDNEYSLDAASTPALTFRQFALFIIVVGLHAPQHLTMAVSNESVSCINDSISNVMGFVNFLVARSQADDPTRSR